MSAFSFADNQKVRLVSKLLPLLDSSNVASWVLRTLWYPTRKDQNKLSAPFQVDLSQYVKTIIVQFLLRATMGKSWVIVEDHHIYVDNT